MNRDTEHDGPAGSFPEGWDLVFGGGQSGRRRSARKAAKPKRSRKSAAKSSGRKKTARPAASSKTPPETGSATDAAQSVKRGDKDANKKKQAAIRKPTDGTEASAEPPSEVIAGRQPAARRSTRSSRQKKASTSKQSGLEPVQTGSVKPPSDKPPSDKPPSDKPPSDKPTSDKPTSDKPTSDKPTSDKPTSDKPESDQRDESQTDRANKSKSVPNLPVRTGSGSGGGEDPPKGRRVGMGLWQFLRTEAPEALRVILIMSTVSGVAGGVLVTLVNAGAAIQGSDTPNTDAQPRLVVMFILALAILLFSKRRALARSTEIVEEKLSALQKRLCDKMRRADLQKMESLDRDALMSTVTQHTQVVSHSVFAFSNATQQVFILVCGLVYLATLSMPAVVLFFLIAAGAAFYYTRHTDEVREALSQNSKKGAELHSHLTHLLYGFKEIRLNRRKNEALFRDLGEVADESRKYATQSSSSMAQSMIVGELAFFLLAGSVVFILPQIVPTESEVLVKATIAVMYIIGPLGTVVGSAPQITNAEVSLDSLFSLESRLDAAVDESDMFDVDDSLREFRTIKLEGVCFSYRDSRQQPTFSVGPFDLDIQRGEILFIVGGNGSGKSTLLKLMTGLYRPHEGRLLVDGVPVDTINLGSYRALFAGVFADFHMFPKLYGIDDIDYDLVDTLLKELEIGHKVKVVDGRFSTVDLSTGQRKRLALMASLLEDRDVYMFDEWTADQDPEFRERFYYKILPGLRDQGKTVIAVTHDDRYWNSADRVIKLDYGSVVEVESGNALSTV